MSYQKIIAGLDIGTAEVKIVIGGVNYPHSEVRIICTDHTASSGIRRGDITDISRVAATIKEIIHKAENAAGEEIQDLFVALPVQHASIIHTSGSVAINGANRITSEDDVKRVIAAAKVYAIPPEKCLIDVIPIQFKIDNLTGIERPVGIAGVRLEVEAILIVLDRSVEQNIRRCVEEAGYQVSRFVLNPLAASQHVLADEEKEIGVVLIDFGAGTTEMSYFKGGALLNAISIPIGGDHITADLAKVIKVPQRQAEELKLKQGNLVVNRDGENQELDFESDIDVSKQLVNDVIRSRIDEILDVIVVEIIKMGFTEPPAAGIKVIGGVSAISGFAEVVEETLYARVTYGCDSKEDCTFATAKGMLDFIYQNSMDSTISEPARKSKRKRGPGFINWIKDFFEL